MIMMKEKNTSLLFVLTVELIANVLFVQALPEMQIAKNKFVVNNVTENDRMQKGVPGGTTNPIESSSYAKTQDEKIDNSKIENAVKLYGIPISSKSDSTSNSNTDIYAGLITPEAVQQYINQFDPMAGYAPYPAPIGFTPNSAPAPIYPGPFVAQTGYDGYLLPPGMKISSGSQTESPMIHPVSLLGRVFSSLMMSTIFKVFAAIISVIGVFFVGASITSAVCSFTPLCEMSFRAVTFLRHRGAQNDLPPVINEDRVRRAVEFVHKALREYDELQNGN